MISFLNVSKHYSSSKALSNISIEILPGEMAFLTGHSGAGKSTLLKLIASIEKPTRGQILVNKRNISKIKERTIPGHRRKIGMIFQNYQLLYDRNVFENVALPLIISNYGKREIPKRVRAALDKVGLLGKESSNPIALSGGEQQRVSIARAIVNKPPIILADEPTGNLDPDLSSEIMKLFTDFNQVGVTVLIASHDLTLIKNLNKRIIELKNGQVREEQTFTQKDT
ncbi:MAG: cell division ATP-binding protein FtsE [Pseudomonadota bacterium]